MCNYPYETLLNDVSDLMAKASTSLGYISLHNAGLGNTTLSPNLTNLITQYMTVALFIQRVCIQRDIYSASPSSVAPLSVFRRAQLIHLLHSREELIVLALFVAVSFRLHHRSSAPLESISYLSLFTNRYSPRTSMAGSMIRIGSG